MNEKRRKTVKTYHTNVCFAKQFMARFIETFNFFVLNPGKKRTKKLFIKNFRARLIIQAISGIEQKLFRGRRLRNKTRNLLGWVCLRCRCFKKKKASEHLLFLFGNFKINV